MNYVELADELLPERYEPDWAQLRSASSESPFMEAAFYILREAAQWFAIVSGLVPPVPLDRNRAILRGLLVRLTKLMRLTMRELHAGETFQQLSVSRDAIETLATFVYLANDDGTGTRFDQYVMNGLVAERELLQEIQRNVLERDGKDWPIEGRMTRSIEAAAKAAGIDDVSALPGRSKIGFPSVERRVELLGRGAYVGYRMGSVETHGDWNDLLRNHLEYKDGEFSPNLEAMHVRPQIPLMLVILSSTVLVDNLVKAIEGDQAAAFVRPHLEDLVERARQLDDDHERFLQAPTD